MAARNAADGAAQTGNNANMTASSAPAFAAPPAPAVAISALFVFLWSTGFVGVRLGLPYCEPLTFLVLRFACVVAIILPVCWLARAPWPASRAEAAHVAVAGILIQAGYLGGVFTAMHHGMPAGVAALVVGLQPILTALLGARLLGERTNALQWFGLVLGFLGVVTVVWDKMSIGRFDLTSLSLAALALLCITLGTIYQKRYCAHVDLRTNSALQFTTALVVVAPLAWFFESMQVSWTGEFVFALVWQVVVLSLGAVFLLFILIRRGAATSVASLMYLVPPTTAILAGLMFGETYTVLAAMGMALGVIGVWLVTRSPKRVD